MLLGYPCALYDTLFILLLFSGSCAVSWCFFCVCVCFFHAVNRAVPAFPSPSGGPLKTASPKTFFFFVFDKTRPDLESNLGRGALNADEQNKSSVCTLQVNTIHQVVTADVVFAR